MEEIYLWEHCNLNINGAEKGIKIVVMYAGDYAKNCESHINDKEFFEKLDTNPTVSNAKEFKRKIDDTLRIATQE